METYEEKYKDLVKRLNKAREEKGAYTFNSVLNAVAPELKIDEDEVIREILIQIVKGACDKYGIKYQGQEISEEKLLAWIEKQGEQKPNYCHHEVDLSGCSEEYRKAYYDGWNNCNQQHAQLEAEQKPWSEDDLYMLKQAIRCVNNSGKLEVSTEEIEDWLKSLSPQNRWKPNEEQLAALNNAILLNEDNYNGAVLSTLREQLKKLREE